ncbi:MAG: 16S rRNA (guanine(966)-N(2))-methyltransferase RsmD [bacterium]|nr:16S rRNA (guanine(966)-N(2))-methyltransferase RsmD [bacterium]
MFIIAGKYKNQKIETPPGLTTRPMLSRIRKSLMDILTPHLAEGRFLDLFSGTGIVALEALSRGARHAISIDKDSNALFVARMNAQRICPHDDYTVLEGDVLELLPRLASRCEPFDVIGITPPYGHDYCNKTLALLDRLPALLHAETVIYTQRDQTETVSLEWKTLEFVRMKKYGRTVFEFFLPIP